MFSSGYGKISATLTGVLVLPVPPIILRPTDYARELIELLKSKFKRVEDIYPENWSLSKADTWEAGLLDLTFLNTAFAGLGDAGGLQPSATAGSIFASLHSADPGETGTQSTNESTYTNYARVAIARSGSGWTRSGTAPTQVANVAIVSFPACGVTGQTVTHAGLGTATSGAGKLMYSGALSSSLAVSSGITPQYAIGALVVTED